MTGAKTKPPATNMRPVENGEVSFHGAESIGDASDDDDDDDQFVDTLR